MTTFKFAVEPLLLKDRKPFAPPNIVEVEADSFEEAAAKVVAMYDDQEVSISPIFSSSLKLD
ncbi:hypothetical protein [Pseudomonas putida]|uniref:Uncharacterized protein n=1 Tax=Pseudomonas putida TaxID=303 RepID=A0A1Q9RB40_PSEPU|nr:hypothetical protein [Pseudomonas putida]OLS64629.1 hypothetical protein PSEMO_03570 [Pseudomonas putida]